MPPSDKGKHVEVPKHTDSVLCVSPTLANIHKSLTADRPRE